MDEETTANLQNCEKVIPIQADHAQSVLAVIRVLKDGHLSDTDIEPFDAGLIRAGYVTSPPYSYTIAEEMNATGLLMDLENAELRNRTAALPVWIEGAQSWDLDSRGSFSTCGASTGTYA